MDIPETDEKEKARSFLEVLLGEAPKDTGSFFRETNQKLPQI